MGRLKNSCGLAALLVALAAPAAHAAPMMRTWVSGVGDDANPFCGRTDPCKTFAGALSKTQTGGEITVLDPGAYGSVTISKSVTINGASGAGYGSIVTAQDSSGIVINLLEGDPYKTVRINGLDINGVNKGQHGIRIVNNMTAGMSVVIENTTIDGFNGSGISDERELGGKLVVANTVVRHTLLSGIRIAAGGKGNTILAVLSDVRVHNSAQAGLTVNGGASATVANSTFSGSSIGIDVEQPNSLATVDGSTVADNGTGLFTTGGAVLRLSNSNVAFNSAGTSGPVESFSNNRFTGNGADGAVAPIGQPTSPTGQR